MKINVDKSVCFSLNEAEDRRELLVKEFAKINEDVGYILSDRAENPQKAVSICHQEVVRDAKEKGLKRIMIFEDDMRFYDFKAKQIDQINVFLDQNQDWELFYLGGLLGKIWRSGSRGIARIRCAGTHSYIVHERAYDKILSIDYENTTKAVDTIYKNMFRSYSPYPLMTRQEDDCLLPSYIERFRDQVVGKKRKPGKQEKKWRKNRKLEFWQYNFTQLHRAWGLKD